MLQPKQGYSFFRGNYGFMLTPHRRLEVASSEEANEPDDADASLDDAAQSEREYVRERLREELKREPTESELDEWLRQHTEGY